MRQLVAELGDVQVARSLPHSPFTAPVVASGGGGVRVAGELLHGGEVTHGVQQIAAEGLSKSVGETSFTLASRWRRLTIS